MKKLEGNILIGQSGGCTAVINQSLRGLIDQAKKSREITGIYGSWNGIEGVFLENFTNLGKQSAKTLNRLLSTPSAALGSSRYKINIKQAEKAIKIFEKYNIRYFFLIGGNDSAQTSLILLEAVKKTGYELKIVAVPKTIDNDLMGMDHTPGYGSVARFAAIVTQEAGKDTESMKNIDPIKIIEFMGRNSGWIAAASGLLKKNKSDPPHLIYTPEYPVTKKDFLQDIKRIYKEIGYVVIVISETIRYKNGKRIGEKNSGVVSDSFGHKYVKTTSETLCEWIEQELKVRARFDKPGTIQRMAMPYVSEVDQEEAYLAGKEAVKLALKGKTGIMVALNRFKSKKYKCSFSEINLNKVVNREKKIPDKYLNFEKHMITRQFKDYCFPLIGKNLPKFANLKQIAV